MSTCKFIRSWIGPCGKPVLGNDTFCPQHDKLPCASCGEPATRECEHTGIQFVCGAPLCGRCEHGPVDPKNPGMFFLGGGHRRPPQGDTSE